MRRGFSLIESLVAMAIMAILLSFAIPRIRQASEQMRLDAAALHLKALWSAQRVHFLETGSFATSLGGLNSLALVDSIGGGSSSAWEYTMTSLVPGEFVATATRKSGDWVGMMTIDETGRIEGGLDTDDGLHLSPGEQ